MENLSVKMVGDKGLIDGARYNDYYVYGETSSSLDFKLDDVGAEVWGLGNYLSWNYSGKLYDTVSSSSDSGSFGNNRDNIRQLRIVAQLELVINGGTVTETCVLTGGDSGATLSPAAGDFKIPMYYLQQLLQVKRPGLDLKSQLKRITYEITPFYYSKANAQYRYGETASVSLDFQSGMNNYNGGDWSGGTNDNWTETSRWDIKQAITNAISKIGSFFSGTLNSAMQIFNMLGSVPALISKAFSFLPQEIVMIIGVGLSLWLLPALLRLTRNGFKALGGLASSLIDLISSFF